MGRPVECGGRTRLLFSSAGASPALECGGLTPLFFSSAGASPALECGGLTPLFFSPAGASPALECGGLTPLFFSPLPPGEGQGEGPASDGRPCLRAVLSFERPSPYPLPKGEGKRPAFGGQSGVKPPHSKAGEDARKDGGQRPPRASRPRYHFFRIATPAATSSSLIWRIVYSPVWVMEAMIAASASP